MLGGHPRQREVETALARLHVAAGDRDGVVGPHHPAQDVQRGVRAHGQVAPLPVEPAQHRRTDARQRLLLDVEPVPDPARVPGDPAYRQGAGAGGAGHLQGPEIVRLAAAAREERRAV